MRRFLEWYADLTTKQRVILWIVALLLSAIPFLGWLFVAPYLVSLMPLAIWFGIYWGLFVAPWLVPLMLFLEFKHESINKKKLLKMKDAKD